MKYIDEEGKVRMLIAKRHPFKGAANYFTSSLLYEDSLETDENPHLEKSDWLRSRYGARRRVSPGNKSVTSIDKLNFNTTANVEGEWYINKNLDLAYFFVFASDSVPSDTSNDIDSVPWSTMDALILLYAPIKSSLMVQKR